ncbi:MAG: hypothetical protein IJ708_08505 [Clostridia bacterium]|nr:hypothetical protein [Clostridia bacterium]MBR2287761.1 hypothetical protein [Clostridia bacterium]
MEEKIAGLEGAFARYRSDIEAYEKKARPTDGLLGFGRSLKDDVCHDRLDESVAQIVTEICAEAPSFEAAERAIRLLLREDIPAWPLAAQWMLRAVERHALPLIPYLSAPQAQELYRDYQKRYPPWDRLPAQKEVCQALKARAHSA